MKRFVLRVSVFLGLCALSLGLKLNPDCIMLCHVVHDLRVLKWKLTSIQAGNKTEKQLGKFSRKEDCENHG